MNKWQASFLVFLLALLIRFHTINHIGKTWDEPEYVERGYKFIQLILQRDFTNPFWYIQSDHPPLARYIYGALGSFHIIKSGEDIIYEYDYTLPRLFSSVVGSASTIFIVLLGFRYFSARVGLLAGLIFASIPFYIGVTQLATLESLVTFTYTGAVFFYIMYLDSRKLRYILLTGFFSGLSLLVKQSNILIFPFLGIILFIYLFYNREKIKSIVFNHLIKLLSVALIAVFTVFILWPMPFFNLDSTWAVQDRMWLKNASLPPPEVFFGRLMLVPLPYYFVMFIVTTPLTFLTLSLIGFIYIDKKRSFITITILLWFLFFFLQSLYPFKQHGVRYIIQLYAPFALICALGVEYFLNLFKNKAILILGFYFSLSIYTLIMLSKISPYYIDYFNELVGGNKYVYNHKLFQMGWWGEGIGEAVTYISMKEVNTGKVGITGTQSMIVVPRFKNIQALDYKSSLTYDYVVVPYFNVIRLNFNESEVSNKYSLDYEVLAGGAPIVKVYKKN